MKKHRNATFLNPRSSVYEETIVLFRTLYDIVYALKPHVAVELGVQSGSCTRCIAAALYDSGHKWELHGYDPNHHLAWSGLDWLAADFREIGKWHIMNTMRGEEGFEQWPKDKRVDFLFVDTDPHSYEQTMNWLNTWVHQLLALGGIAVFHDTDVGSHGVRDALDDFAAAHATGYSVEYLAVHLGLGILRKTGIQDRDFERVL